MSPSDADGSIVGICDIAAHTEEVLRNLLTAPAAAGAVPHPPLITAAVVKGLAHPDFLVEMDAIAVVPA
jgi:enamine deaminase RidA (YjgF/YER057c/UK114 family)